MTIKLYSVVLNRFRQFMDNYYGDSHESNNFLLLFIQKIEMRFNHAGNINVNKIKITKPECSLTIKCGFNFGLQKQYYQHQSMVTEQSVNKKMIKNIIKQTK